MSFRECKCCGKIKKTREVTLIGKGIYGGKKTLWVNCNHCHSTLVLSKKIQKDYLLRPVDFPRRDP